MVGSATLAVQVTHDHLIRYGGGFVEDVIVAADGSWVTTADGRRVLDFTAGQICATIAHGHPRVSEAIRGSLDTAVHLNSWMLSPPVLDLAAALVATLPAGLDRAMLLSTGGESIEAAVRMAKLHTGRFEVASLTRSWHGLTGGAAALTLAAGRRGYGPALPGAFALPAPYQYRCPIRHCRDACDLSCLEAGFDLFVLSKTLGGGIPLGAVVTSAAIEESCYTRGFLHVTSHVSDPLPAAAGLAVLDVVREERLPERAAVAGERLHGHLRDLQHRHECIGDVRGCGLLCGLELVHDRNSRAPAEALGSALTEETQRRGLSVNLVRGGTGGAANCLRMAPPLTISDDEIDLAADILDASLASLARPGARATR